ncbi:MAG: TylF/MycF family methyltransferase [Candidatus Scalindua rubra]|uniref:Demethyldecarbamoylnovobiocin O-methyltransferase n=1 Tax=Candidatus Scalindua brodae TaxID=237368 RepID=A0A0B0EQM3_9BACT|nr:MAG: Demethyldecarbamoylnovobiocin O-methyltransferase [Candidatus Scalindua brodae]MBZ0110416.1 TylF/MycF family methyltransferase [Candidatus Scalindua rubra]TWU36249.1 Demethyldecarbamoylnovobiocin O-methyltransferase [Candidatus Brocadiaceae bacterium S225]
MLKIIKSVVKEILAAQGYEVCKQSSELQEVKMSDNTVAAFLYFKRVFDLIKGIDGDIVECGVWKGVSLLMFSFLVRDEMKGRKLWGFDSFEGFPEPSIQDKSERDLKKGEYGNTSINEIKNLLIKSGLDEGFVRSQITLVKGFFNESLVKYTGSSIALLNLDVDLYDSYLTTLRELYPKVARGGVILFDEYMGTDEHLKFPGAQKAIDEYFGENRSLISRDKVIGKYYLIKK